MSSRHIRSGSAGISMRKPQNAKEAAQRLAQVMAHQPADEEEEEDDLLYDFDSAVPSAGIGLAGGRHSRTRSPLSVRKPVDQLPSSSRLLPATRPSVSSSSVDQQPVSARSASYLRPAQPKPVEAQPTSSLYPSVAARPPQPVDTTPEEAQPPSARSSSSSSRSPSYGGSMDQPLSARLVGRPNLRVKTVSMVPPGVPLSVKPVQGSLADSQPDKSRDKRLSLDFGTFKYKEPTGQQSSSALQDELDMLQEENDCLLEKLRIAEERHEEAESRARQLEKQVASLGEGVSLEARLLSRQSVIVIEQFERRVYFLNISLINKRLLAAVNVFEEVVLKRCWLARCWNICVSYGSIHADIAGARHEYWSSFASRPVEVILAAGRKAKNENSSNNSDLEERENILEAKDEISNKPNVESMLSVERGLRELTLLKVEEAIAITLAQKRRPNIVKSDILKYIFTLITVDELKLPAEGQNFAEAFELTPEESEDVLLKQAWLMFIWRRAKNQGLEPDIAEDRLQNWINQGNKQPNSHDAVDVERGLMELRKLGIETKLWEESRRSIDPDSTQKTLLETEYQILT
ncbi:Unknown protein [Striga hermonthica]|uniref:Uncharacterized protein n=1 Tax=Striga hermonthica TaxID=68872 RepID=A0A9N7N366_STRHE|nr:Unknown protein [Striga hermonthica]